jgi:hypothetical protein
MRNALVGPTSRATLRRVPLACVLIAATSVACGGAAPPKEAEAPPEPAAPPPKKPALKMKSELGSVDPGAIKSAFHALDDKFMACQKTGLDRVELLSGSVKFFVRIGEDGAARWTYLESSEVGDRATEKCLLDVVTAGSWPKPDGGEAEVRYGMELPFQGTRPPTDWSSDKVAAALGKNGDAIDRCKAGASAHFHATMYVGPGGKVLAAGVVAPAKDTDDKVDCLAKVLGKMKGLPSPGSWPAKVGFDL